MGIEPFLLSSSLIGVLAQRLVRVLSPDSRQEYVGGEYERRLLGLAANAPAPKIFRPGDDVGSGYRGRTGIYELVSVDDTMRTMPASIYVLTTQMLAGMKNTTSRSTTSMSDTTLISGSLIPCDSLSRLRFMRCRWRG